jgi:hypothetical protein
MMFPYQGVPVLPGMSARCDVATNTLAGGGVAWFPLTRYTTYDFHSVKIFQMGVVKWLHGLK